MDQPSNNSLNQQGLSIVESGVAAAASCYLPYNTQPIIHGTTMRNINSAEAPSCRDTEHSVTCKPAPELSKCFVLTINVAHKWQNIGVLLGVKYSNLKRIEADYRKCDDCLREMLEEWLNIDKPHPTWKQLAEAVEIFNHNIAEKILAEQQ